MMKFLFALLGHTFLFLVANVICFLIAFAALMFAFLKGLPLALAQLPTPMLIMIFAVYAAIPAFLSGLFVFWGRANQLYWRHLIVFALTFSFVLSLIELGFTSIFIGIAEELAETEKPELWDFAYVKAMIWGATNFLPILFGLGLAVFLRKSRYEETGLET